MDSAKETVIVLLILSVLFLICLGCAIKGQHDRCQRLAAQQSTHFADYCR